MPKVDIIYVISTMLISLNTVLSDECKLVSDKHDNAAIMQKIRPVVVYDTNYLIDNKLGIFVDAEGTRANRIDENRVSVLMINRVIKRLGLKPSRFTDNEHQQQTYTLARVV